jgi:hypothetical protein
MNYLAQIVTVAASPDQDIISQVASKLVSLLLR